MNIVNAFILGIVEGVTEFLPISSTAHLIITSKLLNIPSNEFQKFFEVFIQSGAILAVLVIYWKTIIKNRNLIINILLSFIPTAVVGLLLHKIIKTVFFESFTLISASLFVIGLFFIIFEFLLKKKIVKTDKKIIQMTIIQALLIGLGQSLAVVPGVSRAGAVILTMMIMGFNREESAMYSFVLAVPTLFAASAFDFIKTNPPLIFTGSNSLFLIIGTTTSFISALLAIKWFIKFLQNNTLTYFGVYRILLSFFTFLM
ncbi:undecaprenyl-diphosphatase [Candidatus Roizmanbacteria bacterium CG_4_9_14_3_um_filter_33_18]|uniref:Undecaprenyl-diphosphatase n=1 Tax=Candidatus Roizmanbacteria bacterium CG_4_9_14_3_um_filter_33_18 TaxID=1974841 RepID=A0A2M7XYW0_9BACT|nr:MAG: undecaprenyl-diphosphatase [Candidatus Roizmanbacteria bacterium CG_4_9_14_3_um_filter_33_18]